MQHAPGTNIIIDPEIPLARPSRAVDYLGTVERLRTRGETGVLEDKPTKAPNGAGTKKD